MKWRRILLAAVAVPVANLLVTTLVVTAYAVKLAFQVQGAPDQARITRFAEQFGRSSWFVIAVILTVPAAMWAAHRAQRAVRRHGIVVGAIAGVATAIPGFHLGVRTLGEFVLMVGAGWLGGLLAGSVGSGIRKASRDPGAETSASR
jgi:CDP-diglyceride synthetase